MRAIEIGAIAHDVELAAAGLSEIRLEPVTAGYSRTSLRKGPVLRKSNRDCEFVSWSQVRLEAC